MKKPIEPKLLKGFRDFLPESEIERKRIQRILENIFESFGFVPIDTPVLEYSEVLLGKGGGETDKQVYHFKDHGKRDVAMRFDLTVPFARFMAAHINELYKPFKRYHIAKVWRGENTQKGRYREFTQCDFDIVGIDTVTADFEILQIMYKSMKALGITDFSIHLSNRQVFNRFLNKLNIVEKSDEILRIVDKISKIGENQVKEYLNNIISAEKAEKILDFIVKDSDYNKTLEKIITMAGGNSEDTDKLKEIHLYAVELGFDDVLVLDPSITRGLDYYTGIVFETYLNPVPQIGSVCSGGRYNDLASTYTKEHLPGVGASIGLDRLIAALNDINNTNLKNSVTEVLILCMESSFNSKYLTIADKLRNAGISCEIFPEKKRLKSQFNYAEKKNIPAALIYGEDEASADTVTIKDLIERKNYNNLKLEKGIEKIKFILN